MNLNRQIHFGPIGHMKMVKMMQPGGPSSPVGYSESMQYLSGRMGMRRSAGSHQEFDYVWRGKRSDVQHLLDCAMGMFGPGPFFFLDPMWMEYNVLPPHWAVPSLGHDGAPPIYGEKRPSLSPMPANDGTWPANGALFTRDDAADDREIYIPIRPGFTLRFWYAGTAGAVQLQKQIGSSSSSIVTATPADPALPLVTQSHASVAAENGVDGVKISLPLGPSLPSATIYGMRAVVIPTGADVATLAEKGFVGGRGHSGVNFAEMPVVTPYSSHYDSIGLTARLVEVD